ncbi:ABC transporter substrate-binding protein [Microlunatus parietis]|uniref:ABC-type glycerol-3-phosphate transport system substrate-binding protein n=1 Tax=Microlunatus parietis TaxID=682979 RepID=A0A7Y9LAH5_9ACTN|nr:extracellular solute-binding protein [Microlunatus parietis]NYE70697.1 ABC-type glycerol-3-phosphate transport system substrate-binding protein [Microlunatus parietis]
MSRSPLAGSGHTPGRMPPISRRRALGLAGALGAAGLGAPWLAGCSGGGAGGDAGPAELTFWLPGGEDGYLELHQKLAQDYGGAHPGTTVEVTRLTGNQNFNEVLLARIAGGNPPSATIIWDPPVSFGARGALIALDDLMASSQNSAADQWPESVLASCRFEDKTYGLPFTAGSYGVFYNQEWFEEKGIPSDRASFPSTLIELRELSAEFTRWKGDVLERAGFMIPFDAVRLPIWSGLNGGRIYDAANRRYEIDSEQNIELFEFFLSWLDEEYQGDINKVNESWTSLGDAPPIFQQQRLAMIDDGTWMMGSFYSVEAEFERWEVAPFPVGPSGSTPVSGYWPNWLAIPQASNDSDAAFGYLDYLAVTGAQAQFEIFPDLPTNAKIDPAIVPKALVERRGEKFAKDAVAFFRQQLEVAVPMWESPVHTYASDQLARAIERISTKTGTPAQELADAQRNCQAELDKVG